MDVKISLLAFCLVVVVGEINAQVSNKAGFCPMRDTVYQCTPRCTIDNQCSFNQKCCPNKCGSTSCASLSAVSTGSDGGYKGSNTGTAVFCGNARCTPYEKCRIDPSTRRETCVKT